MNLKYIVIMEDIFCSNVFIENRWIKMRDSLKQHNDSSQVVMRKLKRKATMLVYLSMHFLKTKMMILNY